MEYVFLIYGDETAPATPEQSQEMQQAHAKYAQMLQDDGVMRGGLPLHPSSTATLLRRAPDSDERIVTDGPFTETKEQLGGFYLVECADLDQALKYARQMPLSTGSAVEVRPAAPVPGPQ